MRCEIWCLLSLAFLAGRRGKNVWVVKLHSCSEICLCFDILRLKNPDVNS